MALIKCPECGKEISSMGKACPNCGCPINSTTKEKSFLQKTADKLDISVNELFGVIGLQAIVALIIILVFSGGGSSSTKIAQNIRTADQWVTYCDSEPNIHRCLNVFDKIDHTTQIRIWDDLVYMVKNLSTYDDKARIKKDSWGYLTIYMKARDKYSSAEAFYDEISKNHMVSDLNWVMVLVTDKRLQELADQYLNE